MQFIGSNYHTQIIWDFLEPEQVSTEHRYVERGGRIGVLAGAYSKTLCQHEYI